MFTLIRGGDLWAPEPRGRRDVLAAAGRIIGVGERVAPPPGFPVRTVDAEGCHVVPGFVDLHVHLLGGGGEAGFYGEAPLPRLGDLDEELDRAELAVTRTALDRDMPLFAVCRGIQVLNVALGGTLIQDIATQVEGVISHVQLAPKNVTTHEVRLEPGSMLSKILNRRTLRVNGKHHQAVKEVAPGSASRPGPRTG